MTYTSLAITQFWKLSLQNAAAGGQSASAMQAAQDALSRLAVCEQKLEMLLAHLAEIERQSRRGEVVHRMLDEILAEQGAARDTWKLSPVGSRSVSAG